MQVELFERGDDRRADYHPREPFVVGRHHMPWRHRRRSVADDVLIDRLVSRPQRALGDVPHRELPVFGRLLQPLQKALALFLFGDVEKEFQDHGAVARQIALHRGNVLEAFAPDIAGDQPSRNLLFGENVGMYPRDQAFLVIGTVEDSDPAPLRQRNLAAPEKIMVEFVRGRLLERGDRAALRIDVLEDALDRGVLARGIHPLKDHQQRPAVLGVKPFLKIVQPLPVGVEDLFGFFLVETALLAGLVRLEVKLAGSVETKRRDQGLERIGEGLPGFLAHGATGFPGCVLNRSSTLPRMPLGRNMMNSTSNTP